jgi:hypothetical protein
MSLPVSKCCFVKAGVQLIIAFVIVASLSKASLIGLK